MIDLDVLLLVCVGTNNGLSVPVSGDRYSRYREEYSGCQVVDGNLELVFLTNVKNDLSFLSDIEEVTGYVLIYGCHARVIPLTKLRIIAGRKTFTAEAHPNKRFAVFIASNHNSNDTGLGEIQLKALTGKLLLLKYHETLTLQLL